jgi:hypothetical protein
MGIPDKESIIYDYVKAQYETEKQLCQTIDSRIGNYLVITGLVWGILIQAVPGFIRLSKAAYSHYAFILNIVWFVFLLANCCLLISIIWVLYFFTQMRYSVPGVGEKENYFKAVDSSTTDSKDLIKDFIGNYEIAYKENLAVRKLRGSSFSILRRFIFTGVISTVLFVFIYGFLKINWGDKKMNDETTNTPAGAEAPAGQPSTPAKITVAQLPDHIELGNSKSEVKITVSQKPDRVNLGESKGQK